MIAVAVETLPEHIKPVADRMREEDRREIWATGHWRPEEALRTSVDLSTMCKTIMLGEDPIAIYGVVPSGLLSGVGIPWLLGTDRMREIKTQFIKETRRYVQAMLLEFPRLVNYVDARNTASIIWLKFLGFTFSEKEPFGIDRLSFYRFEMGR